MNRDDIVDSSYECADRFNQVRFEIGSIDEDDLMSRKQRTEMSRVLMKEIDRIVSLGDSVLQKNELDALKDRADNLMESTICEKRDLEWDAPNLFRSFPRAISGLLRSKRS